MDNILTYLIDCCKGWDKDAENAYNAYHTLSSAVRQFLRGFAIYFGIAWDRALMR